MGTVHMLQTGPVLQLQLENKGRANAIDFEMLGRLDECITHVESSDEIRLVLLRGSAGGTFSSGADIHAWSPLSPQAFRRDWIDYGNDIIDRFARLRCPSIAVIEGMCFGGGFELALAADMRIGTSQASFRFPEVGIAALPGWRGGLRLQRLVGMGRMMEAVLFAHTITAEAALSWGVLNVLCDEQNLQRELQRYIDTCTQLSPLAQALAKAHLVPPEHDTALALATEIMRASPDAELGLHAFRSKQTPHY